ncbi:MAG: helix-turn-helix transcriptional regulator [Rubrivivax sp.]|nr:helix-turn-helix transcriptional regulator [Rubrivivax sp.]MBK8529623.1 helix-turn-helix transcriptional regulator [Rubrivivax sp.]
MKARSVHLQYSFRAADDQGGQRGADVHNPLFELLSAIAEHGSIQHAAKAMGASYRHVWGACKQWESQLGEPLLHWVQGQPARLTPFAQRLLWAEKRARSRLVPHIEALRIELERVLAEALDGSQQVLSVHASHDLALPLLRDLASPLGLHVDLRFAGSMDALRALAEGRCMVAGFHVPPLVDNRNLFARGLKPLLKPGQHKLIGCMQRSQGLMVARGNPLSLLDMADVVARGARFIHRQQGSGTRLLAEHLLAQQGLAPAAVQGGAAHAETSHLAVAAAVAAGVGDVALGIEAAARSFDLDFVPLVSEEYHLVCLAAALDQPPVQALRQLLQDAPWAQALATLPGYRVNRPGEVLSLTKALPWWQFRTPKAAVADVIETCR